MYMKKLSLSYTIPHSYLKNELLNNEDLYKLDVSRQSNIKVQRETEAILLRVADRNNFPYKDQMFIDECVDTDLQRFFPLAKYTVDEITHKLKGKLGRVLFARLLPNCQVYPHIDGAKGGYYDKHNRYHIIISSEGSEMTVGEETEKMYESELWWFDNMVTHSARNIGNTPRDHLIFDIML